MKLKHRDINAFDTKSYIMGLSDNDNMHSYLILGGGDITNKVSMVNDDIKKNHLCVNDVDGCPCTVLKMRHRFLRSLKNSGSASRLFMLLRLWMTENDIKMCFYDLWLKFHNYEAIRRNRRDLDRIRCERKRGIMQKHGKDDFFISHITTSMNSRDVAMAARLGTL